MKHRHDANLFQSISMQSDVSQYVNNPYMSCDHLRLINVEPSFLSPFSSKTQWTCLYDGCIKIKKNVIKQDLATACNKLTPQHKIMIHCETFEIYCTECQRELYDLEDPEQQSLNKHKRIKKLDPIFFRQFLLSANQSESIMFAGNPQYPPSFQKEKRGLCGLKKNSLSSYMNSLIQLFAYVPIIKELSRLVAYDKLESKFLAKIFQIVQTIWTGKYRIYKTDDFQHELIKEDENFKSYHYKNPQNLLYLILRKIYEEFYFTDVQCKPGEMINQPYDQWKNEPHYKNYTFLRENFAGQCILQKNCSHCHHSMVNSNKFECLKVSYEKAQYQDYNFQAQLLDLIQQALNWRNNHHLIIKKIQQGKFVCEKCSERINQYYTYVDLPNNLIIQFGEDIDGINVLLPDQIDLHKFTQDFIKNKTPSKREGIYEYVGSIYRKNKRFITHVRNKEAKKQFSFCDEVINESQRSHQSVKLAIYKRQSHPKNHSLDRNIASCLEVNINPIVPLPDFWSLYLKLNFQVPPLINPYICSHGKLKTNLNLSKCRTGSQRVPVEIYQYLLEIFGGRPINITHENDQCKECIHRLNFINDIKASQKEMASFADKLSNKKTKVLINMNWLEQWKRFVYEDNKKGYRMFGNPRPSEIKNNSSDWDKDLKDGFFKKISPEVWYFLQKFYGGGPLISNKDYLPNSVLLTSVNLRFDNLKAQLNSILHEQNQAVRLEQRTELVQQEFAIGQQEEKIE